MKKFIDMKEIFKNFVAKILIVLAKKRIKKAKPIVVGVTGSIGKTSTKEAVTLVLKNHFKVLSPPKSYNTEIGMPLVILEEEVPPNIHSVILWSKIIIRSLKKIFLKFDYQILVLEYGADKPGDIKNLVSIVKPHIAIETGVFASHIESYNNLADIGKEKSELVKCLDKNDWAVLNFDNKWSKKMADMTQAKIISFGADKNCDFSASDIHLAKNGLSFKINYLHKTLPLHISALGKHFVYPILAAFAVGEILKIKGPQIAKEIQNYQAPKGRMRLIEGIKDSFIIDDTYNANEESMIAALDTLQKVAEKSRKIAVLGNINELGKWTEKAHRNVGKKVAEVADILVTVGNLACDFLANEALKSGIEKNNVVCFDDSLKAGDYLKKIIKKDDFILLKGSQNGVRLEKAVKKIMKNPEKASDVLVRQEPEWKVV